MKSSVSIVKCPDYEPDRVLEAVRRSLDLLGGVSNFIPPRSKVLVKPNLLMATGPESGVDTHPEVVRAAIKILKENNCSILVGDSPSVWNDQIEIVQDVYRLSGIAGVCREEGVELVEFDRSSWRGKFPITAYLDECDYLVSLPKFKTHLLTTLTAAIKNNFGLVSGTYKAELHRLNINPKDFSKVLVDVFQEARPVLSIVDGIIAMEGDGPGTGGKLCQKGLIVAGADAVAVDSVLAKMLGLEPLDILTTRIASERKLGTADLSNIKILGEKLEEVSIKPLRLPKNLALLKMPRFLLAILKKFIHLYPYIVDKICTRCLTCVKICPQKTIQSHNGRINIHYDNCISCFCCQESCPAAAIKVKKSLLAKIIGL